MGTIINAIVQLFTVAISIIVYLFLFLVYAVILLVFLVYAGIKQVIDYYQDNEHAGKYPRGN